MTDLPPDGGTKTPSSVSTARRVAVASAIGGVVAAVAAASAAWQTAPLLGWATAALIWLAWTWTVVLRLDAAETGRFATREEPHLPATGLLLVTAVRVVA
jgi:uncharacterized membrane protein